MINVTGLTKAYKGNKVLDNIAFSVRENSTLAILGESGCGKTTLLRLIAGLEEADGGSIEIDGRRMDTSIPSYERNIAVVFQEATLWNHMTVYDNIVYGMKQRDRRKVEKIAEKLQIIELLERYPEEISGGQAKRVALARAFAAERAVMLLDEPLSNIDTETKEQVLNYIKSEYCGRKTIIYVTHDDKEVNYLDCEVMHL